MKGLPILFLSLLIFIQACSNEVPTESTQEDKGKILFSLDKQNAPSDVVEIVVTLSRENYNNIIKSIIVNETNNSQILFENIDAGTWEIFIEAFNNQQTLLYFGETEAIIIPGVIVPVNLQLSPTTGSININVTWGTHLHNNIIAFYPFLGNADDYSGNELNGTLYGPTLIKDRFNNDNSAYYFDGINDFIDVNPDKRLQIEGDLTISVWIKVESFSGVSEAIVRCQANNTDDNETNALYSINFNYGSNNLTYAHESGQGVNNSNTFENFIFSPSIWYNIIIVRNISKKTVELYINGTKKDEIYYAENPTNGSLSYLRIGENQGTVLNERFFHGTIDDLIIFNKSLSKKEIELLYNFSK